MSEMTLVLDYLILPHIWPYHWLLTVRPAALSSIWLLPARRFLLTHLENDEGGWARSPGGTRVDMKKLLLNIPNLWEGITLKMLSG